jgi:hypothetical protein
MTTWEKMQDNLIEKQIFAKGGVFVKNFRQGR